MSGVPITFSAYMIRNFLLYCGIVLLILGTLVFLADISEILRRTQDKEVGFGLIIAMALMKFPMMAQKLLPFIILFGAVLSFARLNRTQELIVARSSGISVWQFLLPVAITAFVLGLISVTIINPISSVVLQRYESLENKFLLGRSNLLAVSDSGLWLRQRNTAPTGLYDKKKQARRDTTTAEPNKPGEIIIHAPEAYLKDVTLHNAVMFVFGGNHQFIERIDAKKAKLNDGYWDLDHVIITGPDIQIEKHDYLKLETDLTFNQIQDSFASPETISFWSLPQFINTLANAGFSAIRHRLYLYSLLAVPVLLASMVLVAGVFTLHNPRSGRTNYLIASSALAGFLIYFTSDVIGAIGLSGSIPILLAAWAPALITGLSGFAMLLHMEDG